MVSYMSYGLFGRFKYWNELSPPPDTHTPTRMGRCRRPRTQVEALIRRQKSGMVRDLVQLLRLEQRYGRSPAAGAGAAEGAEGAAGAGGDAGVLPGVPDLDLDLELRELWQARYPQVCAGANCGWATAC